MYNSDYIPLDQTVIDQTVSECMKKRQEAKDALRDALKDAGGNYDIIAFRKDRKRVIRALENLRIFWCEVDGEILVSRHELYETVLPKE